MKRSFSALVLAALVALAVPADAKPLSGTVSTDGSTSMEKVIGSLGEAFENEHRKVKFTYNPTGSGAGIAAAKEGRCDIGLASRALKEKEKISGRLRPIRISNLLKATSGIMTVVLPPHRGRILFCMKRLSVQFPAQSKIRRPVRQ